MTASPGESQQVARTAMAAAIAANRGQASDPAGRFILDGLSARLARLLAALERDLAQPVGGPFGTVGRWGPNGRAPEIEDLIRRSAVARRQPLEAAPRPPPTECAFLCAPSRKG
jgi:hypothetical protein